MLRILQKIQSKMKCIKRSKKNVEWNWLKCNIECNHNFWVFRWIKFRRLIRIYNANMTFFKFHNSFELNIYDFVAKCFLIAKIIVRYFSTNKNVGKFYRNLILNAHISTLQHAKQNLKTLIFTLYPPINAKKYTFLELLKLPLQQKQNADWAEGEKSIKTANEQRIMTSTLLNNHFFQSVQNRWKKNVSLKIGVFLSCKYVSSQFVWQFISMYRSIIFEILQHSLWSVFVVAFSFPLEICCQKLSRHLESKRAIRNNEFQFFPILFISSFSIQIASVTICIASLVP